MVILRAQGAGESLAQPYGAQALPLTVTVPL